MRVIVLAVSLAHGLVSTSLRAETRSFQPIADTTLFATTPSNNLGRSDSLAVGGTAKKLPARGLLRFDLSGSLPVGAVVTQATLAFSVTKAPAGAVPSRISLHPMLVSWAEGSGTGDIGSAAMAGEPTWLHRVFPGEMWSAPGGGAGVDFAGTASASVAVVVDGIHVLGGEQVRIDIEGWLADPSRNFGWILMSDGETTALTARRIGSREDSVAGPTLTLDYFTPAPPVLTRWGVVGDRFEIEFVAEAGNIYEVQAREQFATNVLWQSFTNVIAKLVTTNITVSEPLARAPARFFRVADVGDVD